MVYVVLKLLIKVYFIAGEAQKIKKKGWAS
jgi:hypothetical protein